MLRIDNTAALAALSFLILHILLPPSWLRILASAVLFGAAFAAGIRYAPAAFRALQRGLSGAEVLVVAVFAMATCQVLGTLWHMARASPFIPTRSVPLVIPSAIGWAMAWAMLLALAAPDTRAFPWRSMAVFSAASVMGLLVAVQPLL